MATINLKPLDQQVIVITGASSGIGLTTAQMAAQRGAKLVLAARSGQTLHDIVDQINAAGGQAIAVPTDVVDRQAVQAIADAAIQKFGRIDTWVNNAGVSVYARLDETEEGDARRVFDTNFWGLVNGSIVALPYLKESGGALINVGSEVSEAVAPLQGIYSASKHAVKGFTDTLRVEIQELDDAPIAITLIQPTAVDTPYPQHAKNYLEGDAKLPDPMIEPTQVAEAILGAAEKPERAVKVGMTSKLNTMMAKLMPSVAQKMGKKIAKDETYDRPAIDREGALHRSSEQAGRSVGRTHGEKPVEANA
ncbi:MAG: SDR family oxidoreductase [Tepidisphaeraceae bacterium]